MTLWLIVYGTVLSILITLPLAMLAATRKDGIRDHVVRAVPLVGLGLPPFWLGIMLLSLSPSTSAAFPGRRVRHRLRRPPAFDVPAGPDRRARLSPVLIRSLRASMLQVLDSDYIMTARSKGLPSGGCSSGTRCATPSSRR